jgi:quinol monooxygenase YgiN
MYVQIVNFNLTDATETQYRALCDDLAPTFGAMPGLLAKYWLADAATNTYGSVIIWEDRASMEAYMNGEVAAAVIAHPNLANITSRDFDIIEAPTRVTHGFAAVAAR